MLANKSSLSSPLSSSQPQIAIPTPLLEPLSSNTGQVAFASELPGSASIHTLYRQQQLQSPSAFNPFSSPSVQPQYFVQPLYQPLPQLSIRQIQPLSNTEKDQAATAGYQSYDPQLNRAYRLQTTIPVVYTGRMHVIVPEVTPIRPVFQSPTLTQANKTKFSDKADQRQEEFHKNVPIATVLTNLTESYTLDDKRNDTFKESLLNSLPTINATVVDMSNSELNASAPIAQEYLGKTPFRRLRNRFHDYFSPRQVQLRRQKRRGSIGNVMLRSNQHYYGPYLH